jgi:hypothetical protein
MPACSVSAELFHGAVMTTMVSSASTGLAVLSADPLQLAIGGHLGRFKGSSASTPARSCARTGIGSRLPSGTSAACTARSVR